jgi:hypothetical protein
LFWETWSNKTFRRKGWGLTSKADALYYLFWDKAIGYRIENLPTVIFNFGYYRKDFKEVPQDKYNQHNDTFGCLVPVTTDWLHAKEFSFEAAKNIVQGRFAA